MTESWVGHRRTSVRIATPAYGGLAKRHFTISCGGSIESPFAEIGEQSPPERDSQQALDHQPRNANQGEHHLR